MSATTGNEAANGRLRILHLVLVLGPTNSQYNEHCLPQMHERALSICTYFTPLLTPPPQITVFPGDGSVRGFFRALRRSLAADDYDAIHAHAAQSGLMLCMALVARPSRFRLWRRTVYTVHDSWYDFRPRNKLLMLPALALFRRVVFCSQAAYDSAPRAIRMLVGRRARVVQNAADLARVDRVIADTPPSRHDGSFTIVSVGRLDPVKDPIAMVDAFVAAVADDSRLVMIGAGSLEKNVAERIAGTGRAGQIELTGLVPREEVFARYAHADLFVSPSHGEGLPVAVMEAMASGLPAVLSDIPPHRELTAGLDGVPLVSPGDVAGFAREIARFRDMTADERLAQGQRCREHVNQRFTLARMHAEYDQVYRQLPGSRQIDRSSP